MHDAVFSLVLILAAALAGGRLATRFGYPAILGEIIAGIVLGPPLLGILSGNEAVDTLGDFGVLLMMLYIGMHLDMRDLRRASLPGFLAATGGFLVPTAAGLALMLAVGRSFLEALFVGLAMGITSLAIKSRILFDLKILDTRIAHVLVAGALLSDVAVLVVFAAVIGPDAAAGVSLVTAGVAGLKALAFGLGAWLVGSWLLPGLKRIAGDREIERGSALLAVIIFGLLFAWTAEMAGLHSILGAFVAGLFIDKQVMNGKLSRDVQQRLSSISIGVLAPFFFVSAGFKVTLDVFRTDLALLVAVVAIATVGKIVGTAVFYLPSGNGWREGVVIGAGMNGRGAVEIIVAEIALARGLIGQDVFSILVFMALFTTAADPILLTLGIRWLRRRGELVRAGDRTGALIIGAGSIARSLAGVLQQTMPVTLVDTNRANLAAASAEGLTTRAGNGLDVLVLEEAGIETAMRVIAATPNAEINILAAQLAMEEGVPEVSVLLGRADLATFSTRLEEASIGVIPAPEHIAAWEHALTSGGARAESVPHASLIPAGHAQVFPIAVISNGDRYPFTGNIGLDDGDELWVIRLEDGETGRNPGDLVGPTASAS